MSRMHSRCARCMDMRLSQTRQSRSLSLVEAASNVVAGFVLAVMTQLLAFPFFGIHLPLATNLSIGGVFTAASMARSYLLRRLFESVRMSRTRSRRQFDADSF